MIDIEDRKLNYILNKANLDINKVNQRFIKIDGIMNNLKIGDKIYDSNCWGDKFEQIVTKIIDKENGIVELHEKSIDRTIQDCVLNYYLTI